MAFPLVCLLFREVEYAMPSLKYSQFFVNFIFSNIYGLVDCVNLL